jgi:hypothetical protein
MLYSGVVRSVHPVEIAVMVDSLLAKKSPGGPASSGRRLARTILLGTVAVAFAIYWLARSYGVDTAELLAYVRASAVFVMFFAAAGCAAGVLLWLIRRR